MSDTNEVTTENVAQTEAVSERGMYEIAFHLTSKLNEEEAAHETEAVAAAVRAHEGEILMTELPTLRPLTYPMSKVIKGKREEVEQAYFGWMQVRIEADKLPALMSTLGAMVSVMRVMSMILPKEALLPRPALKVIRTPERELVRVEKPAAPAAPAMTEEELDKTIESLVVE